MSEGEFRREKVLFHVVGQGEVTVEYEVGAETPEEAFRRAYDESVSGITKLMIVSDVEFVTTVATEPMDVRPHSWQSREWQGEIVLLCRDCSIHGPADDVAWKTRKDQEGCSFDVHGVVQDDPDWESRINWTNRSDAELAHHLRDDHLVRFQPGVPRSELNLLHDRAHGIRDERESDEYARAREDEADQWRMNR